MGDGGRWKLMIECDHMLKKVKKQDLKVPLGHGFGADVPTGQKKPEGHKNPVGPSSGDGSEAPPMQTYPAAHGPLGVLPPRKENQI